MSHRLPSLRTLPLPALAATAAALAATAAPAAAQARPTFSITWHGPTVSVPDCASGVPITEGDVLITCGGLPALGPLPAPGILLFGGPGFGPIGAGLPGYAGCVGHPGGTMCGVELDALSYGKSHLASPNVLGRFSFSADENSVGLMPMPAKPTVWTEAPVGDLSADMLVDLMLGPAPLPPFAAPLPGSVGWIDGDGLAGGGGIAYPGFGLREPNLPGGALPATGDDTDAFSLLPAGSPLPTTVYFSLDGCFPDPLLGIPNSCSAAGLGFSGADVLMNFPPAGGLPLMYAPAPVLGLDILGPQSDDLDALVVSENGVAGFQPSQSPYDWLGGGTDMLLFSVRRGSAVIGMTDSILGLPIEPGDILTTPLPTFMGGLSPFPGIFVAAENLGLATVRGGGPGANWGDDLDALELWLEPLFDCNANGVEDAVDIALGTSADANTNGIPDECEAGTITPSCFCDAALAPCGNAFPSAGCRNSSGLGALLTATGGTTSVGADDLVLGATQLPPGQIAMIFMGPTPIAPVPFGDGLRCVAGPFYRFAAKPTGAGSTSWGPGLVGYTTTFFPPAGQITSGSTWHFQSRYRDPFGPCGSTFNTSNALSIGFTP